MIVVGAGIIGLSCAWRLAQRGASVTVFDAREVGREASWAGAGMLAPGGEVEADSQAARMAVRSLETFPGFVAELQRETAHPIDFRQSGAIELAFSEEEAAVLERKATIQEGIGISSRSAIHEGALSARFYPGDSVVNPRDITAALRIACERHGVVFHQNESVLEVYEEGCVRTTRGEYRDHAVLIAAGAWSSELLATVIPSVPKTIPVRGHLMAFAVPAGMLGPILRNGHTYLLQRAGGALIAGSSTEYVGFDRRVDEIAVSGIHSRASRLLPALAGMKPVERWNGFRPGIQSDGPLIGKLPAGNLWAAFGHYRNGILLAPETARILSESLH